MKGAAQINNMYVYVLAKDRLIPYPRGGSGMMESKYKTIYRQFVQKIEQETLKAGASLPSEGAIMQEFCVSKETVRKALALLESQQYIIKRQGKESIVNDRSRFNFSVSGITSFKEVVEQQHLHATTEVVDLSIVVGDATAMRYLGVSADEEVYRLKRLRIIDGQRSILDIDYLLRSKVPMLTREVVADSLYAYIEGPLHLTISYAKKIITVSKAGDEDRLYLQLPEGSYVVNVQSFTSLEDGTVFQYTESHHIIDRFQFIDYQARRTI